MSSASQFDTAGLRQGEPLSRERPWLLGLCVLLFGLRVLYACNMRLNSDETQHLHVVWGWANGYLQYRDVFDNHTPLFHLLCAPLFRLFGETAKIIIYMRLAMIACFGAALWCTLKIGESLFSRRAGMWAAMFAGFAPWFFLKTVEFRTDDLWAAACLATVAIAVGGSPTAPRILAVGLALGTTFAISMKTTLLALALLLAGAVVLICWRRMGGAFRIDAAIARLGAGLLGLIIVPAAIVAFFAMHQAIDKLYDGAIAHNLVPHPAGGSRFAPRVLLFPLTLPLLIWVVRELFRRSADRPQAALRSLVLLTAVFYLTLLHSYWPMITAQDYLPVLPLLAVLAAPAVLRLAAVFHQRWNWAPMIALPLALVGMELTETIRLIKPRPRLGGDLEYLSNVLHFTDPGDYVMDAKSGAIFRRRPFYYALENVTRLRMEMGLIKDDIVERLIATRTCMAADDRLKGRDLAFVKANYVPFDHKMRVAGQLLHPDATGRASFEIAIAASYTFVTPNGTATGAIDGQPFSGKVFLEAGRHEFLSATPLHPLAVVWSQALERGFRPKFSPEPESTPQL